MTLVYKFHDISDQGKPWCDLFHFLADLFQVFQMSSFGFRELSSRWLKTRSSPFLPSSKAP